MNKSLFLGNGINLLTQDTKSWVNVLKELSKKVDKPDLLDLKDFKPFSLIYEAIYANFLRPGTQDEYLLKKYVADLIGEMQQNSYHRSFLESGIKHIITTNYDYCLEKSVSGPISHKNVKPESRYSLFRRTLSDSTYIWHIHGEINKPNTIMLGYEQYGGYLQKLRNYLTAKGENYSPLMDGNRDFESDTVYSWTDVFLRDEIHIIGFSLDYSEIDLWWLLSYKSRLIKTGKLDCGPTYYYLWTNEKENDRDRAKIQLLESLGVKVKTVYGIKNFSTEYDNFISRFNK